MKYIFPLLVLLLSFDASAAVPEFLKEGFPDFTGCSYTFSKNKTIVSMYDNLMRKAIVEANAENGFTSFAEFDGKMPSRDLFYSVQDKLIRKRSSIPRLLSTYGESAQNFVYLVSAFDRQVGAGTNAKRVAEFITKHVRAPTEQQLWIWKQTQNTIYKTPRFDRTKEQNALDDQINELRLNATNLMRDDIKNVLYAINLSPSADGKYPWSYELVQATNLGGTKKYVVSDVKKPGGGTESVGEWVATPIDQRSAEAILDFYKLTIESGRAQEEVIEMGFLLDYPSGGSIKTEIIETILGNLRSIEQRVQTFEEAVAQAYRLYGAVAHLRVSGQIDQKILTEVLEAVKERSVQVFGRFKDQAEEIAKAYQYHDFGTLRSLRTRDKYDTQKSQLGSLNRFFFINGGSVGLPKLYR